MIRALATAPLRAIRRVGNWLLETRLDPAVCRLSNELGGDDE